MQHFKTHSGEKLNKCNQCEFAFSRTDNLRTYLKKHSGEKSNRFSPNKIVFFSSSQYVIVVFAENKFADFVGIPLYRLILQIFIGPRC